LEVYEVKDAIRVERVQLPKAEVDGDNEEGDEEIEIQHDTVANPALLGALESEALLRIKVKRKCPQAGKWITATEVQFILGIDENLEVDLREAGKDGASSQLRARAQAFVNVRITQRLMAVYTFICLKNSRPRTQK
jgi:heat shock protein 1/8